MKTWLSLAGISLGIFMFTLDACIVNIAVPTLVREFHGSFSSVQWVIQGYLAVIVLLLFPAASIARRIGHKPVFLAGLTLFALGSLLCGFAPNIEWLIGFRLIQAAGAVCMASLMTSIVSTSFPPSQIGVALGTVTAFATLGSSLGPTIGGILIASGGWRSIFFVNVPVGIIAIILVSITLPNPKPSLHAQPSASFLSALGLFRIAGFRNGLLGRFFTMAANSAFLFLGPLLLEEGLNYSTVKTGILLAAVPILIGVGSPLFGHLSDRFGSRFFLLGGLTLMIAGLSIMGTFAPSMNEWTFLLRVACWGIGVGMFNSPNSTSVVRSAPPDQSHSVSAFISLAILAGELTGVAAGGSLFHLLVGWTNPVSSLPPADLVQGVGLALAAFALPLALVLIATIWQSKRASGAPTGDPNPM